MASLLPQVVAVLWSPMSRTNWWWAVRSAMQGEGISKGVCNQMAGGCVWWIRTSDGGVLRRVVS